MQTKKSRNTSFPIKYFIIKGLYGYKSLEFKTKGKTTIVVSENGSGKTTLLDTLHNVLKGNIPNLKKILSK